MTIQLDYKELQETIENDRNYAISTIYKSTIQTIYKYIFYRVYNQEDAEDITEEVYMKLMKQLDTYDGSESIQSWLYTIAKSTIADYWREKYKVNEDFLKRLMTFQESFKDNVEAQMKVADILHSLPENYAKVLELRFLKGYTLEECAQELKTTVGNIKVLQFRALKKAGEKTYEK